MRAIAIVLLGVLLAACASRNETYELERFRPAVTRTLERAR